MSKRPNSPSHDPRPPSQVRRRKAGFRVARAPSSTAASGSETSQTLFVTVDPPTERGRSLRAQTTPIISTTTPETSCPATPAPTQSVDDTDQPSTTSNVAEENSTVGSQPDFEVPQRKRIRHTKNVDQLTDWLRFRSEYLDEILRHDGLGDFC